MFFRTKQEHFRLLCVLYFLFSFTLAEGERWSLLSCLTLLYLNVLHLLHCSQKQLSVSLIFNFLSQRFLFSGKWIGYSKICLSVNNFFVCVMECIRSEKERTNEQTWLQCMLAVLQSAVLLLWYSVCNVFTQKYVIIIFWQITDCSKSSDCCWGQQSSSVPYTGGGGPT